MRFYRKEQLDIYTMDIGKPKKRRRRKRRVKEPLTNELLDELLASSDPAEFARKHKITHRSLPDYLQQLLDEKGLKRSDVVREAGLDATYGYNIFMGTRSPSREKLLPLLFTMKCTLQEANRILRAAGHSELYVKDRRDAIIIYGILHQQNMYTVNDELFEAGEETLS